MPRTNHTRVQEPSLVAAQGHGLGSDISLYLSFPKHTGKDHTVRSPKAIQEWLGLDAGKASEYC